MLSHWPFTEQQRGEGQEEHPLTELCAHFLYWETVFFLSFCRYYIASNSAVGHFVGLFLRLVQWMCEYNLLQLCFCGGVTRQAFWKTEDSCVRSNKAR